MLIDSPGGFNEAGAINAGKRLFAAYSDAKWRTLQ